MESLAFALGVVGLGTVLSLACSSPGAASVPHPPGTISDESGITDASDTVLTLGPNGTLLAGWLVLLDSGRAAGRFRLSTDRGDTWSAIYPLAPRVDQDIADPLFAFRDPTGNPMLAWTEWTRAGDVVTANALEVGSVASDGSLLNSETAFEGDASNIYLGPSAVTTDDGTALLAAFHVALPSSQGSLTMRTLGTSASPVTLTGTKPTDSATLPKLCGSGAGVGVAFVETDTTFTTTQLSFRRSDDHGASWPGSSSVVVSEAGDPLAYAQPDCGMDNAGALVLYQVSDAAVRAVGAQTVNHVVSLRIAHLSIDGQIDFRTQVTSAEEGGQFASPRLVLGQDGRVDVVYYCGADPTDPAGSLRVRSSTDGARTFAPPVILEPGIALGSTGHGWLGAPAAVRDSTSLMVTFANNVGGPAFVQFLRTP
jgi:hypothetical protein